MKQKICEDVKIQESMHQRKKEHGERVWEVEKGKKEEFLREIKHFGAGPVLIHCPRLGLKCLTGPTLKHVVLCITKYGNPLELAQNYSCFWKTAAKG